MPDNVIMGTWPSRRLLDLLGLEIPIIQAPMAGADSVALTRSVSSTGALGSLACALLGPAEIREAARAIRRDMQRPFNLNFFCHSMELYDPAASEKWKNFLRPHYARFALDIDDVPESRLRTPFDEEVCDVVEEVAPDVVSFHFGLPAAALTKRIMARGIKILSSATTVREARWLQDRGGWDCRLAGFRRCFRAGRSRRADRYGLPVLPGSKRFFPVFSRARTGCRQRHSRYESVQWPPCQRHSESLHQRSRTNVRSGLDVSLCRDAHSSSASSIGEKRFARLHAVMGWTSDSSRPAPPRR